MKFYEARARIDATPDAIWPSLIDGGAWPSWGSGIAGFDGVIAPGAKVAVRMAAVPDRAFKLKVTEFDAPRRFVLAGGAPLGMFHGKRTYTLTAVDGGTDFLMREEYTGWMLGAIWKSMPDLQPSFDQFVSGLKSRVESVRR